MVLYAFTHRFAKFYPAVLILGKVVRFQTHQRTTLNKAIADYTSATSPALCTPVTNFPPIGDAAYRQHAGGGPSHGHRQHVPKNLVKICVCGSGDILADRQTDRQTHTHTHSSQYFTTAPAGEVMITLHGRRYNIDFCRRQDSYRCRNMFSKQEG